MRRKQSGITLIELVVLLVILALLGAAIFPQLGNLLNVMKSKGASEEVAGAIILARQYAITRGTYHCVDFASAPPTTSYTIREGSDTTCAGSVVEGPTTISQGAAIVNLFPTPSGGNFIVFSPVGNVSNFTPGNPSVTAGVDTDPASCLSSVLVTLYGGVRVSRQC
jgi:type II secretory pathway pseudopilin PulG